MAAASEILLSGPKTRTLASGETAWIRILFWLYGSEAEHLVTGPGWPEGVEDGWMDEWMASPNAALQRYCWNTKTIMHICNPPANGWPGCYSANQKVAGNVQTKSEAVLNRSFSKVSEVYLPFCLIRKTRENISLARRLTEKKNSDMADSDINNRCKFT